MFDTLHDPVQIMFFGFELPDWICSMRCDQNLFAFFSHDRDRNVSKGSFRNITLELVHDFEVFLGDVKNASPYFFTGRGNDAGQPASPLGGPPAKLDRMLRKIGIEEKLVFRCTSFELGRIQIVCVEKELHRSCRTVSAVVTMGTGTCSIPACRIVKGSSRVCILSIMGMNRGGR